MIPQQNPLQYALHKYLYDLLQDKYQGNTNIISRVAHYLATENDLKEFSTLVADLYEKAYSKALQDYHKQLEAAGVRVAISYGKEKK